ncbi:NAD(P)H-hydrate dehydratase [Chlamydiales bacterium]|nr:NAD(P)H-hydrate dehydratase [Chlamydiales bacterium]
MKVITPSLMREIEERAFSNGVSDLDLMKNAGRHIAHYISNLTKENSLKLSLLLLCGKGNNGGDAYVTGIHLLKEGFAIQAIQLGENLSPLCKKMREEFIDSGGTFLTLDEIPSRIDSFQFLLDGLFGTGFSGAVTGEFAQLIELANNALPPIIAIDIPSGLNGETGVVETVAIQAFSTLTLCLPKTGLYLNQGWNWVGHIITLPIGLPDEYLEEPPTFTLTELQDLHLPPIIRNRHKYQRGNVMILAGSPHMMGSSFLSSLGAFRGGAGIVHLLIKSGMESFYTHLPELITIPYDTLDLEDILILINHAKACIIGPGFGRSEAEVELLTALLPHIRTPSLLDADALWFLSNHETDLFQNTLLTPHHGEMSNLLGYNSTPPFDHSFILESKQFAEANQIPILLKGGPTVFLSQNPETPPNIIPFGDPGMATAGAGDLLSGIIGALLAQQLPLEEAAILGASLHGIAGELAAETLTSYSLKASDIADYIPAAFQLLLNKGL